MLTLNKLSTPQKLALCLYLLLSLLGFCMAATMSYERYAFNHQKTVEYYLGNPEEGEMAFQKPFGHLVQASHVHTFTMPLVFFVMWILFSQIPLKNIFQYFVYLGGSLSILIYNLAPYLVRFVSAKWVGAFTVGGIGLFFFYCIPVAVIFYEIFVGFKGKTK